MKSFFKSFSKLAIFAITCLLYINMVAFAKTQKKDSIKVSIIDSFEVPDIEISSLAKMDDNILLLSEKYSRLFLVNPYYGTKTSSELVYEWPTKYSAIITHNNKYYMLNKEDGVVYQSDNFNGKVSPVINVKKLIFGEVKKEKDKRRLVYEHFAFDGENFYLIIIDGYSSQIIKLDPETGKMERVSYIRGFVAGLFYKDGKVYYLCNSNNINDDAGLDIIDMSKDKRVPIQVKIPCKAGKGIVVDDNYIYSFSKLYSKLYKFKIE